MKELGAYLKEQRIATGVGAEEAASDLEITLDDIENIESGNIRAFKDVLLLKEYIRDYAKYLGLSPEKIVDEFNDVLFEKTSKISLDDILETKKEIEEKEKSKCWNNGKIKTIIQSFINSFITLINILYLCNDNKRW